MQSDTEKTQGNPQGKGLVPVLEAWQGAQPRGVAEKSAGRILTDYFITLLVLSADFHFRPVPGRAYYLYLRDARWRLSLISPEEWGKRLPGQCLGCCRLQPDMTWSLELLADLERDAPMRDALVGFHGGFLALLENHETLETGLPHYVAGLPYYRRLLAAGLAASLSQSLELSGLSDCSARQWLETAASAPLLTTDG
jgi:hypothetical protein